MRSPLWEVNLRHLPLFRRGKVRDNFDLGDHLLLVATDRISAFDVVLPTPIPDKGRILTQMSLFWFDFTRDIVPNHFVTDDVETIPQLEPQEREMLRGRSLKVVKARVFPVECVVRGYLAGSGWREYRETGKVCGVPLPSGLREADRLPQPIFTPATKAVVGHDENISFDQMVSLVGGEVAERLRDLSLQIYAKAAEYALQRGIILADTKFEFGQREGDILLVDEILTPDSSRFWDAASYRPGGPQPSFDKQFVRDYLLSLDWDRTPPGPPLPDSIVERTREKYWEAFRRLTGREELG